MGFASTSTNRSRHQCPFFVNMYTNSSFGRGCCFGHFRQDFINLETVVSTERLFSISSLCLKSTNFDFYLGFCPIHEPILFLSCIFCDLISGKFYLLFHFKVNLLWFQNMSFPLRPYNWTHIPTIYYSILFYTILSKLLIREIFLWYSWCELMPNLNRQMETVEWSG